MTRIKFLDKGAQRAFLIELLKRVSCPSLRAFEQFGFDVPYSTLKNYFVEARLLPEELFFNFVTLGKFELKNLKFQVLEENWGRVKGGKSKKSFNTLIFLFFWVLLSNG
jgi:hypothetical protein